MLVTTAQRNEPIAHEMQTIRRGGEGGIRTHDEIAPILVFETSAFVRSATSPWTWIIAYAACRSPVSLDA